MVAKQKLWSFDSIWKYYGSIPKIIWFLKNYHYETLIYYGKILYYTENCHTIPNTMVLSFTMKKDYGTEIYGTKVKFSYIYFFVVYYSIFYQERRHNYRYKAANVDLCSTPIAIEHSLDIRL